MSRENVEIVRRVYRAISESDFAADLADPGIEVDMSRRLADPEVYRGLDGVRRFAEQLRGSWRSLDVVPDEVIDAGEQIVVIAIVRGVGLSSGADVVAHVAHVLTLRGGKVLRLEYFGERDDALRAVGLLT